ncbi:hypothetical protein Tco_0974487 [Tanacetum coccineum]|uniref:Uncharacterized protein n=1 Tax=Tanacetum coccineum TaxID=301880 RepID=A0ABQ5EBQ9_9ASTR
MLFSLFGASSNPTTLSRCLRTLGDLVRSGGVTSLVVSDHLVPWIAPLIVQIWARSGFDGIEEFWGCLRDFQVLEIGWDEALAQTDTTLATLCGKHFSGERDLLRHSKLFEGFKVQLGEDPIQARKGGLRAGGEGTSSISSLLSNLSAICNDY